MPRLAVGVKRPMGRPVGNTCATASKWPAPHLPPSTRVLHAFHSETSHVTFHCWTWLSLWPLAFFLAFSSAGDLAADVVQDSAAEVAQVGSQQSA